MVGRVFDNSINQRPQARPCACAHRPLVRFSDRPLPNNPPTFRFRARESLLVCLGFIRYLLSPSSSLVILLSPAFKANYCADLIEDVLQILGSQASARRRALTATMSDIDAVLRYLIR